MGTVLNVVIAVAVLVVGGLVSAIMARVLARYGDDERHAKALEALRIGVDKIQLEYVQWWKRSNADGKLTRDECFEAVRLALDAAVQSAADPAIRDIIRSWSYDKARSLIERILEKKKGVTVHVDVTAETAGSADSRNAVSAAEGPADDRK